MMRNTKGWKKTFYTKEMFENFAKQKGCKFEIVHPDNSLYWNNQFVFDFYLYK